MSLTTSKRLLDELSFSEIYNDYERAFGEHWLPLNLRLEDFIRTSRPESTRAHSVHSMAKHSKTCAGCLEAQQNSSQSALSRRGPSCVSRGYANPASRLRTGENLIGFLQTGEVMLPKTNPCAVLEGGEIARKWGIGDELKKAEQAWVESRSGAAQSNTSLFCGCWRFSPCT